MYKRKERLLKYTRGNRVLYTRDLYFRACGLFRCAKRNEVVRNAHEGMKCTLGELRRASSRMWSEWDYF